jgi:hypothetical protein
MSDTIDRTIDLRAAVQEIIERAAVLVRDHDEDLALALEAADIKPMPRRRAELFYERILTVIRNYEAGSLDADAREHLLRRVRQEVAEILPSRSLELMERYGLEPQDVRPIASFNGVPVNMRDGFVSIERLRLWDENPRSGLHTEEFSELNNGRSPDADELYKLVVGQIKLPGSRKNQDPFELRPLARSIARKGVERPIIVTDEGTILDGNRRWAASKLVLDDHEFDTEDKERARWVRVWKLDPDATPDQIEAVVVALNFEPDLKEPWPEYVKARRVSDLYDDLCERKGERLSTQGRREIRREVAKQFAVTMQEVTRYVNMVRWADDFQDYHVGLGRGHGKVRHRTNEIFQWFYEIDAGRGHEKLRTYIEADENVRAVTYDLMFDVLDSGAQVRALHKVVPDPDAWQRVLNAHKVRHSDEGDEEDRCVDALGMVKDAIDDVNARRRRTVRAKAGFDEFLQTAVERFGQASPDDWSKVDPALLREVLRVCRGSIGSIEGALGIVATPGSGE